MVGALARGAALAYMGTRFMATVECPIHDDVKNAIVAAGDAATISWGHKTGIARTLKNRFTDQYNEREFAGASPQELHAFIGDYAKMPGGRRVAALRGGDLEDGEVYVGAGAGLIRATLANLNAIFDAPAEARQRYAAPA